MNMKGVPPELVSLVTELILNHFENNDTLTERGFWYIVEYAEKLYWT